MTRDFLPTPRSARLILPEAFERPAATPLPAPRCTLLVVDDEPAIVALLAEQLGAEFDVTTAATASQARRSLRESPVDIVLTDLQLPDGTGIQLLDWVHQTSPGTARVLLTGTARIEDAADAINCSRIHRMLLKPWRGEDLVTTMRGVARTLLLERRNDQLLGQLRASHEELEDNVRLRTSQLEEALQQLQVKNQILEKMALTDPLTGLPNRRAIELIARKELLRRARTPSPIAFGLIDADHFRAINTAHLHCGGDHALVWLGQKLQGSLRAADALGRVGGEEFMVVAPVTDAAGAEALGERLRVAVAERPTLYQGVPIVVTVSLGFAVCPAGAAVNYEALRKQAAAALSEAKGGGRNRCVTVAAG